MKEENKIDSINYWNRVSGEWNMIAYDGGNNLTSFPSSQVRHDIIVAEIVKTNRKSAKILDIGCADGKLVTALIKEGFTEVKGIDNAPEMIAVAKQQFKKELPGKNPDEVFFVGDADSIFMHEKFDFVTAMGLIEYVKDIKIFFKDIKNLLNPRGIIYAESMNKLFNLFSANTFTRDSDMAKLLKDVEDIKNISPINENFESIVKDVFISIGNALKNTDISKKDFKTEYEKYPFDLPQYTPKEIMEIMRLSGLHMEEVIYYHCHPFAPTYEKSMPHLFNTIGLLMQPLGYTPLGALICSAFIVKMSRED